MPSSEQLSPAVLQDIAAQISDRMPQLAGLAPPGAAPGIGESFKLVMLPLDRLREESGALADRVVETGQWHHQIYAGAAASNFARSTAPGAPGAPHQVVEVVTSPLGEALKTSIEWVDANIAEDAQTEILIVPDYYLTGLWLHGADIDAVVIASMPPGLQGLSLNRRIESGEFMRRLAENTPAEGSGVHSATEAN